MIKDILVLNELHSTEYQTLRKNQDDTIMNEFYHEALLKQRQALFDENPMNDVITPETRGFKLSLSENDDDNSNNNDNSHYHQKQQQQQQTTKNFRKKRKRKILEMNGVPPVPPTPGALPVSPSSIQLLNPASMPTPEQEFPFELPSEVILSALGTNYNTVVRAWLLTSYRAQLDHHKLMVQYYKTMISKLENQEIKYEKEPRNNPCIIRCIKWWSN
eukprot:UN02871